jgi:Domain of unknown function (DUF4926)
MSFELFSRVALKEDFEPHGLCRGDIATIVDYHPGPNGENGYSLEVFNALGETIAVLVVGESQIEPLSANEILQVRIMDKLDASPEPVRN